ncbi:DNA recombination protein RmuC, partial [Klebsiella pneumoniae]
QPALGVHPERPGGVSLPDLVEQATAQDEQYRLEDEDNLPENDAFSPDSAETVRSREAAPPR